MKKLIIFLLALVNIFLCSDAISATYDATGRWNYTKHSSWDNCDFTRRLVSWEFVIFKTEDRFFIEAMGEFVDDKYRGEEFTANGIVSGNIYNYSDKFCDYYGDITENTSITLTSETSGTGIVNWSWQHEYYYDDTCSGGYQITITKDILAESVYNINGRWKIEGFWTGVLEVTQTGNKIAAADDQGQEYTGFVDGSKLEVGRSYNESGSIVTLRFNIILNSETQGTGVVNPIDCGDCGCAPTYPGYNEISITKLPNYTITASASEGGNISPSGQVSVYYGENKTFTITPNTDHRILAVKVDGSSVGRVDSYTFSNVSSNHTIEAIFAELQNAMPWIPLLLDD